MKIHFLTAGFYLTVIALTGCQRGVLTESIIGDYSYIDSGTFSRYVDHGSKRIIDDIVIRHAHDDKYIYALRQVSHHYICNSHNEDKAVINTEVTSIFEYWLVEISNGKIYGPLDQLSFNAFIASSGESKKLPLPTIDEILKSNGGVTPKALSECKDAELIDHFKLIPRKVEKLEIKEPETLK